MKRTVTLLLLLCGVATAHAQNKYIYNLEGWNKKKRSQHNFQQSENRSAYKTTATHWRLVAAANYQSSGTQLDLSDSTRYYYSGNRGFTFDFSEIALDDYGVTSTIFYDSLINWQDQGSGLDLYRKAYCEYDANDRKKSYTDAFKFSTQFQNNSRTEVVRNANWDITESYSMNWSGTKWDTSSRLYNTYDSQNKLIKDSTINDFMGTYLFKSDYTYDGNGNLIQSLHFRMNGSNWDSSARYTYTYYPDNKKKTELYEWNDTTKWVNQSFDTFGYNNTSFYTYNEYREWDTLAKVWVNSSREIRTLNSKNLPSTAAYAEWDDNTNKWEPQFDADIKYDADDKITMVTAYPYLFGIKLPTPAFEARLYYEHYFYAGINNVAANQEIMVYPNPASDRLNVVPNGKDAHMTLYNMTGQAVRSAEAAAGEAQPYISVAGLTPGNYIIHVVANDGTTARQTVTVQ